MEPISLTAIAVFLAPYLKKAGEKIAEKTVETLFNSHHELAEKFTGLFKDEIITLHLNDSSSAAEIRQKLEENPEVTEGIGEKVKSNHELMGQLTRELSKQEGRTITAKTYIENIEHIENASFS